MLQKIGSVGSPYIFTYQTTDRSQRISSRYVGYIWEIPDSLLAKYCILSALDVETNLPFMMKLAKRYYNQ